MFIKSLTIASENEIIREIIFRKGINLIVDETINLEDTSTGNNVGKTTVLKLVDFCFGAEGKIVYTDQENPKITYPLVKEFLENNKILITLILVENLDDANANQIIIERNFLSRKNATRRINEQNIQGKEFESELTKLLFPEHQAEKPSLRQLISHNIRFRDESINNTLKTLNAYTSDAEYETLYLFLFGCNFNQGNEKQEILTKLRQEHTFQKRLEKNQTKNAYETMLSFIEEDIQKLNKRKVDLNLNENFEQDLDNLNLVKYQINRLTSEINKLKIRRDLIKESEQELAASISNIDVNELFQIYIQTTMLVDNIQKTFDDLLKYHNQMLNEKIKFISKELPQLEKEINNKGEQLKQLLKKEKELANLIAKSDTFEDLEKLISNLNEKYRQKGEYENIIQQLNEVEKNVKNYYEQLNIIDETLFSDEFEKTVKSQTFKFNKHFSEISGQLYGEQYAVKYDIIIDKSGQKLYKFSTFNLNFSSGKKQGEISAFDIAYISFADEESIPCLHFLLNDKKELMHDNQLSKIAEIVNHRNIQFVASILKDKLPTELNQEDFFVLELSQNDKLFRIENQQT
ncbi:MAG: DUF2326 domain-containing protein [Chitinophagales bacterium]|nr:DUF2326 domain-containing protein [Chitinophagales bacterium]